MFLGLVFVLIFGCINLDVGEPDPVDNTTNGPEEITYNPAFSILYPSDGSEIETTGEHANIEVLLQTSDMVLVAPSMENEHGYGHFVFTLDDSFSETISETTYTFTNVPLGEHILTVEFVNNDGSSYDPRLIQTIHFSVVLPEGVVVGPEEYSMTLKDGSFDPESVTIKEGDIVTFTNEETIPHAIKIGELQDTAPLKNGESYSYTFEVKGEYEVSSLMIPTFNGVVIVTE